MDAFDLNHFLERIEVAEETIGRAPTDDGHGARRVHFGWTHQASALRVVAREVDVVAGHACDARLIDGFVAVGDASAAVRVEHDRTGETAVTSHAAGFGRRDLRIAAHRFGLL